MNSIRVASLCFVVALVFAARPAQAQIPARVAALEAAVAALDGRLDKLESGQFDEADLAGTYAGHSFAIDLTGDPAKVQTETAGGTFTLRVNGTASITGMGIHCRLQQATPWFVACDPPSGSAEAVEGTWFLQDGSLVLQVGGEDVIDHPNFIGAGGRVIISGGTADLTGNPTPEIYSLIMIAIRLPNP